MNFRRNSLIRIIQQGGALAMALSLSIACTSERDSRISFTGNPAQPQLGLTPPAIIDTRRIDEESLFPVVVVNGQPVEISRSEEHQWGGIAPVAEGRAAEISITWFERIEGMSDLPLAEFTTRLAAVGIDSEVLVMDDDYLTDKFDNDSDSISNLAERLESSDHTDATDPGINRPLAIIPAIDPNDAPVIDGSYDAIWGEGGGFNDRLRQPLKIDNLMIDNGARRPDGETEFQWVAMHDGIYLYLLVFGESVDIQTPFGDSEQPWQDDTVEIFWSTDISRSASYDGVNDFNVLIPQLQLATFPVANRSGEAGARIEVGVNSAPFPLSGIDFVSCLCPTDRNLWEMRIRLADAKIPLNQSFGFEVQIDEDADGALRDAKYGWFHPSREPGDSEEVSDRTWFNPSVMGRVRLEALDP